MRIGARYLWSDGRLCEQAVLKIEDGKVVSCGPRNGGPVDREVHLAMPACTDLQVNGGGGVMVNDAKGADGLRTIAAAHRALGTGWIMPTVITDAPEVLADAVEAAIETAGEPGLLGLHIEGPHLAERRRGTHAARYIRPLDRATVDHARALKAAGLQVIVTLAPELADPALLAELVDTGAVVSAGHSGADLPQARAAFDAGVTCVTHLFNAMDQMSSRAPGLLGAAIDSEVYCGIIADGLHVTPEMLRIALRGRPSTGLTFVVSDAMATVGGPDSFWLYGNEIRAVDGHLINAEGAFAGAHIDMVTSLANLLTFGVPLAQAIPMVTDIPRKVLGLPPQSICDGWSADDLLLLDAEMKPAA